MDLWQIARYSLASRCYFICNKIQLFYYNKFRLNDLPKKKGQVLISELQFPLLRLELKLVDTITLLL